MSLRFMPRRMRPLSARKSALLCVLDIGTSKIACLIAKLAPAESSEILPGRTHRCRILGIGHQRSRGIKGGAVVDMDEAESAIRLAVDAAERMAGVEVSSVIVNVTGGRLSSQHYSAKVAVGGKAVSDYDVHRVLEASTATMARQGRAVLHSLPTGFTLDRTRGIRDPKGMIGDELGADMHVVGCDAAAARNLILAIERCHLSIEAMVATPYAAGLSVLVDDEAELDVALIDMGGGTTSVGVFAGGHLAHVDAVAVGGNHVTTDIARGLTTRLSDAERLKTLHGTCIVSASDERETIAVPQVGDEHDQPNHLPKSHLVRIIRPRVEEILELVRDRLAAAGFPAQGRRLVLSGGASLLTGMPEAARRILSPQVRIGRPLGIQGLPESAKSPAFAASVGLLIYPQVASVEHFEPRRESTMQATGTDGYMSRVSRWLKESF
ncbi:MAG TPA: cell division protein FtsA [Lichenihabitans sp.]|jgi:cell division protein FtsA|nr:cell division protein FtsA [Lichenihabitans sp.]